MERLAPLEKIWVALQVIEDYRQLYQLYDRDDQIPIPDHKFQEYGLYDPADIEAVLGGLQQKGVINVLEEITDKYGLTLPVHLLDEDYPTYYLRVNPEEFNKYYEETKAQILGQGREEHKPDLGDTLKGAGIEYNTSTGEFNYGRMSGKFRPSSYQGRALILLLNNVNQELDLETIWKVMEPYEKFRPHENNETVHNTITNLRRKLGLSTKKLKREHNYYTLVG